MLRVRTHLPSTQVCADEETPSKAELSYQDCDDHTDQNIKFNCFKVVSMGHV